MTELEDLTNPKKPNRWTLTAGEISDLLGNAKVKPWLGSPFMHLKSPETISTSSIDKKETPQVCEALTRIACPDVVHGLLHYPPETPDVTWFYGVEKDQRFVAHRQEDDNNHHIVWPIYGQTLVQILETALQVDQPAVADNFSLSLDRVTFETLTLIVDFIQEENLLAALGRQTPPQLTFDANDLFKCYMHNQGGIDLRWMVQRAKLLSPSPLVPNPENLDHGLESLSKERILTCEGDRYKPTERFNTACSLMSACIGFCAISTRRRVPQSKGDYVWELQHFAALRGIGSLWLFEFSNVTSTDFTVKLGDITSSLLHERIQAGLLLPETQTAEPSVHSPEKGSICQNCGAQLHDEMKFCTKCGTQVQGR